MNLLLLGMRLNLFKCNWTAVTVKNGEDGVQVLKDKTWGKEWLM